MKAESFSIFLGICIALSKGCGIIFEESFDKTGIPYSWKIMESQLYAISDPLCITDDLKVSVKKCDPNNLWIPAFEDLPECTIAVSDYEFDGDAFNKISKNPEIFSETDINLPSQYPAPSNLNVWQPCRKEEPDKFLYPFSCYYRDDDNQYIRESFLQEKECLIANTENIYVEVDCNEKYHLYNFGVDFRDVSSLSCPEGMVALTFERAVCYGDKMDKEGASFLEIDEFISLSNIFSQHEMFYGKRIHQSTTFEEVDVQIDTDGVFTLTSAISLVAIMKLEIQEKDIRLEIIQNENGQIEVQCYNCEFMWSESDNFRNWVKCYTDLGPFYINFVVTFPNEGNPTIYRMYLKQIFAHYWCYGYSIFGMKRIETEKFFGRLENPFNEFCFTVAFNLQEYFGMAPVTQYIKDKINPYSFVEFNVYEILEKEGMTYAICHIVVEAGIDFVSEKLSSIFEDDLVGPINSTDTCFQEPLNSTITDVFWTSAGLNEESTLNSKRFLNSTNEIPRRKCLGDLIYGAQWEVLDTGNYIYSVSYELTQLLEEAKNKLPLEIADELENIVTEGRDYLVPSDFDKIGRILETIDCEEVEPGEEEYVISNITSVCNSLLETEPCRECKHIDKIANQIEDIIDTLIIRPDVKLSEDGVCNFIEDLFYVFAIDVTVRNICGMVFYNDQYNNDYLYTSSTDEEVMEMLENDAQIGTYIPIDLINHWNLQNDSRIVIKVYKNDNLFLQRAQSRNNHQSNITSISVPFRPSFDLRGFEVPLIMTYEGVNPVCNYWNFTTSRWKTNGLVTKVFPEDNLVFCNLSHLTPFTNFVDIMKPPVEKIFWLDFISIIFSILSFLGIIGIFFTASILRKWRKTNSTKILLQLTFAIFVQIALLFVISAVNLEHNFLSCFVLGLILQYFVLVQFMWMMIIAITNWMFYKYPFRQNLASMWYFNVLAWCIPLIPITFTSVFGLMGSARIDFDFNSCLPYSSLKLWTFVLPLFSILAVNVVFFGLLLFEFISIWRNKEVLIGLRKSQLKPMLRNMTMFFFVLGLPWIFGLFHISLSGKYYPNVFSYLFVLTAPLQGFILFVYFVVINPSVHEEWTEVFNFFKSKR